MLPAAVFVPLFLGLIQIAGLRAGWYNNAFAIAVLTIVNILFFSILVGWSAWKLANGAQRQVRQAEQRGPFPGGVIDRLESTEPRQAETEIRRLREELEERVKERTAQLEEANRELEAFAYTVSHDLRAPLRHISGFIQFLKEHLGSNTDEKSRRYLKVVSDSAKRMSTMIDDILHLSRIGRSPIMKTTVDLRHLVDEARAELAPTMANRTVEWRIGDLPSVPGDPVLLRIVMVNLLSNAVKYTRFRNPAQIKIEAENKEDQLVCHVRDNGVGFDMQFADNLFRVFQRLHASHEFEGTGIGLASVRRIIERHGGKVWADGTVDQGATFSFSLPNESAEEGEPSP